MGVSSATIRKSEMSQSPLDQIDKSGDDLLGLGSWFSPGSKREAGIRSVQERQVWVF